MVKAGSTLLVARHGHAADLSESVMENATLKTAPGVAARRVAVRKGEDWAALARRLVAQVYAAGGANLQEWNPKAKLRAGPMSLRMPAVKDRKSR